MRRLRVLHVVPYSADAWAYGGIPRVADTLARGLSARGHDVTVCATDVCDEARLRKSGHSRYLRPWRPFRSSGVEVRIFPNVSNRLAYRQQMYLPIGLSRFLSRTVRMYDVAHLHACRNVLGAMAATHLHRAGVPYVLAPNGTAAVIERHATAKGVFDWMAGRRVVDHAACVIAVSGAERVQLTRLAIPERSIRSIPNPVDLGEFTAEPPRGWLRSRIGAATGEPLVLMLGRLSPRKRPEVLVRAFAELGRPGARLVIAGNDAGTADRVRALARELRIADRVAFTGLLRGEERISALADADVVVYPSEHEVFGLVPLEALLAGTPVIVGNDSGCGEIIDDVGGGQCVPVGDHAALASAIRRVLGDPVPWRDAARDAAGRLRQRFAADVVCEQLERLYCEVARVS